ncbi:MAG TPA: hypothetical protein ENH05_04390 [Rhizobiales bacterium]|nr:hypothetical protein BMS3Bbin10_01781 [bacterium BMS3Bbin10]HDO51959.1 hypothetical protein [Hyphomicrobiales bacterium]
MTKKIAVLVRDRQEEALRMALGLTLADDAIDVFVLGGKLEETDANTQNLELFGDMGVGVYSDCRENGDMEFLSSDEIANRLIQYDHVLPY